MCPSRNPGQGNLIPKWRTRCRRAAGPRRLPFKATQEAMIFPSSKKTAALSKQGRPRIACDGKCQLSKFQRQEHEGRHLQLIFSLSGSATQTPKTCWQTVWSDQICWSDQTCWSNQTFWSHQTFGPTKRFGSTKLVGPTVWSKLFGAARMVQPQRVFIKSETERRK